MDGDMTEWLWGAQMPTVVYPQQWLLIIEILYGRNNVEQPWLKYKTDIYENEWLVVQTKQTIKQKYEKVNNFIYSTYYMSHYIIWVIIYSHTDRSNGPILITS